MWKSLKRYSTAPFIKFVIFHLCTARAINAFLTSLGAGSFDMKNVILCISGINLLLLKEVSHYYREVPLNCDLVWNKSVVIAILKVTINVHTRS
jgi:hypothetical protein